MQSFSRIFACALVVCSLMSKAVPAQAVPVPAEPRVGLGSPASPEPPVTRPHTTPCSIPLLQDILFNDGRWLKYVPPSDCPGPWSKVVLSVDFSANGPLLRAGTVKIFLGGVNLYYGATGAVTGSSPTSWHVERDVTELSAVLKTAQLGQATIDLDAFNGIDFTEFRATATLLFYPADAANLAPVVPDKVLWLANNVTTTVYDGVTQHLTLRLPHNIERAYLDVIAVGRQGDEYWFEGTPADDAVCLGGCPPPAFREVEVAIDDVPAGVAPIYPVIAHGLNGNDPFLSQPITGVDSLNFKPYRVDLTPFAGELSNGVPHTVSVGVPHGNLFEVATTILLYTDPHGNQVTGGVTKNSLSATPLVRKEEYLSKGDGVSGPVYVSSAQDWTISGCVETSHGRVNTTIQGTNSFKNTLNFHLGPFIDEWMISQETKQEEITTTVSSYGVVQTVHDVDYPLIANFKQTQPLDAELTTVTSSVQQRKIEETRGPNGPNSANPVVSSETVELSDRTHYAADRVTVLESSQAKARYGSKDQNFNCFYRDLVSRDGTLTDVENSTSCSMAP